MTAPVADQANTEKSLANVGMDPALAEAHQIKSNLQLVKDVLAPGLSDQEMMLFAFVAQRLRLDPFVRQLHAVKRQGKLTFQTGIDGFRSSAEETGEYRGTTEPEFGPMLPQPFPHPEWAKVGVIRAYPDGTERTQYATAHWTEFYPGDNDQGFMYRKMPRNQLAKCAEAAAFRRAFPKRFAGVYAPEEMEMERTPETARPVGPTTARDRVAQRRAQVEGAIEGDFRDVTTQRSGDNPAAGAAEGEAGVDAAPKHSREAGVAAVASADPGGSQASGSAEALPGINAGELRTWLRENNVGIQAATGRAQTLFGGLTPDGKPVDVYTITDQQRAELRDDLAQVDPE